MLQKHEEIWSLIGYNLAEISVIQLEDVVDPIRAFKAEMRSPVAMGNSN